MPSVIIAILAVVLVISIWYRQNHGKNGRKLPPGPRALPIIGNLHQIGTLPHRSLQKLSQKHGHIMSLWLGNVPAIVVSYPQAASLFLKTHGLKMADRPKIQAFEYLMYGTKGMAFSEYGPRWRNTRRICNLNLLSSSKIESFASLRKGEIGLLVQSLKKSAETSEVVDISSKINEVVGNISTMMILGKKKDDLKGLVEEVLHLIGAFNLADYVPLLGKLDLQGLARRMKKANKLIDQVMEKIITEHEQNTNKQNSSDFIIALLSMMDKPTKPQDKNVHAYDRTSIKAILVELITAAYDTPAVSVEWTISELIRNPRVMKKLQDELQNVIGMGRMVEEKDLAKLDYLYMVVKESLRLHPVAPFPPRECTEDTTIEGYHIPKKSRIIVNVWAIGHDQNVWSENVEEFYPERFIEKNIDVRGNDFDLIPFGSGQRICAGMQLGLTTVKLVVAQLVHCFNLELPSGMKPDDIDMTEVFGLALPRANHLLLKLSYRLLG